MIIDKILEEMKEVFKEDPSLIEHTLKVLQNAKDIMEGEDIKGQEEELITLVAILHDIGIIEARKKYGSSKGIYQEKEGARIAEEILQRIGYNKGSDRICHIIANHHTPSKIDGIDFQIQWEADLLENLKALDREKQEKEIKDCIDQNFKTKTGVALAHERFF